MSTSSVRRPPHFFPDSHQRAVLRAALMPAPAALTSWRVACPDLDPATAMPVVQRLLPLLARNLRANGLDDARLDAMDAITDETRARNDHLFEHGAALMAAMERAGIPTVLLKGAALVVDGYGDTGLRPMSDLDFLVPTEAVDDALPVLAAEGWTPRYRVTGGLRRVSHDVHIGAADGCQADLHWHVFHDFAGADDDAELWARTRPGSLAGFPTRMLSREDQLLHVIVHGLRWVRTPGIRWVADAMTLLQTGPLAWERVIDQATRRRFTYRTSLGLRYLRTHLDAAVPEAVVERLVGTPITPLERLEYAVSGRPLGPAARLPGYWCHFVRTSERRGPLGALGFAGYLASAWELPADEGIATAVVGRARDHFMTRLADRATVARVPNTGARPAATADTPSTAAATIVIPVLRQLDAYLEQAVRSALDQTVPAEVIVIVAAVTPPSNRAVLAALAAETPHLRVITECGRGFGAALNTGFRAATTERLGILLSDDWLDPDALESCLPIDADLVSAGTMVYAADGVTPLWWLSRIATTEEYERRTSLEDRAQLLSHFLLLRRSAVEVAGWVDETLGDTGGIDDYDLPWTLLERGATVGILGRSVYNYRDHAGERLTLRDVETQTPTMVRILEKHGITGDQQATILARHARWWGRPIAEVMPPEPPA
ncbi:MAG: nucleotidyltransferase family protein [Candidatus Limnocylindrales bacterium]